MESIAEGIPASLTLKSAQEWVASRVSSKRLRHTSGVVATVRLLAQCAGCSPFLSELCAWLHDACKDMPAHELVHLAEDAGLQLLPIERLNGHLLHGPVAAITVQRELCITNMNVLDAISQHTLGAAPMSALAQVIYLSDWLEPGRPQRYTQPIWQALDLHGTNDLDRAVVVACDLLCKHLIETGKLIHPTTVAVRNYYITRIN